MKKFFAFLLIPVMTLLKLFLEFYEWQKPKTIRGFNVHRADMGAIVAYACRSLQGKLVTYFGKNIASNRRLGDTSYIKWLLSPQNTSGFRKISDDIQGVPGKKRGVAFRVDAPFCFNVCSIAADCNTEYQTATNLDQEVVFDLDENPWRHCDGDGDPVKLQFDEADLERFCTESDTSYISDKIAMYLLRWEEALNAALATKLLTQIGTNAVPEPITNLPFFTASNQFNPNMAALNGEALWALDQVYNDMGGTDQFAIIGGKLVSKMAQFQKWATMNAAGVDLSKAPAGNPYPFYSRDFNNVFGERDFILFTPGAQQLVTWNKYKGEKQRKVTDLYSKGTIVLPTTGLEVDWKWWYDYNCEKWTFEAFLHAELATVPAGGCGANVAGVNGIIRVHDCGTQPIMPVCPEVIEEP